MTADEAVVSVLAALDAAGIPYMIVGSLASNFHGIPRSTWYVDVVIELVPNGLHRLAAALSPELTLQSQSAFEGVTATTRYVITLAGSPFICELFVRSDDAHDQVRFERRQRIRLFGRTAFVASAEDMIITKLRWAPEAQRPKDYEDVRNILAVRGQELDWRYLSRWTSEHGTSDLLRRFGYRSRQHRDDCAAGSASQQAAGPRAVDLDGRSAYVGSGR